MEKRTIGWIGIPAVHIEGDPHATPWNADASETERRDIIDSWRQIAVLAVVPDRRECFLGFRNFAGEMMRTTKAIEPDSMGRFGVRIGNEDVTFFVLTVEDSGTELVHLETVELDDFNHPTLPLY
jgi:hypothetical protein